MNKYLVLAVFPFFASCVNKPVENTRPSYDTAELGEASVGRGLKYPHKIIDQSGTSTLDVSEDIIGDLGGDVTRKQVRKYSGSVYKTGRRGSRIFSSEVQKHSDTLFDIGDGGVDVAAEQIETYPNIVMDATGRTLYMGGTLIGSTMMTYGNVVDSAWNGIFNGLLRGVFIDTKPYMVGSANDLWPVAGMPGAGWRGRLPQMPPPVAISDETSGKNVVTFSK
ncbi:MAG: hypothetical protein U0984_15410 [Prosthecobacter sp.]|nr:hypothetical protein [Prosthecobacter sp.]